MQFHMLFNDGTIVDLVAAYEIFLLSGSFSTFFAWMVVLFVKVQLSPFFIMTSLRHVASSSLQ